ncbi:molybdopterin-dependent oxidoreductase [Devosia sp.]|uniref:molybdopterin-dependent oxidoreductase n=1 Tax=Devosia sp. TaxID=1871048 RepID=UPI0026191C07|nr:molybdopterin-dependent oxidoreductase [Devosia sp.]
MSNFTGLQNRRHFLRNAGIFAGIAATFPGVAETYVNLDLPGGPNRRELTSAFPQKAEMILQRTRPPLLETPFEVFDQGVFTPNDRFFVRWHWAVIPQAIDVTTFTLTVRGHVNQVVSLSLGDLLAMPRVEVAAVCQCSGNSRGLFEPRVAGAQWQNGAMGNARWVGVSLRNVLDLAGVKAGAVAVRSGGLDDPVVAGAPKFMKPLDIDHARDGEVMLAFQMNGEQLPLLNGFPVRLVVPGWYADYWVKMLSDIEVLDAPDQSYFEAVGYRVPDTPHASVTPGQTGFKTVPVSQLVPRSFFTNVSDATTLKAGAPVEVRGIAFGGDSGVAQVALSLDGGQSWMQTVLGEDQGPYSFRQWSAQLQAPETGTLTVLVRCTNTKGEVQPAEPNWNGGGFMRNVIERVQLKVA